MTASAWSIYNSVKELAFEKVIDLNNDTLKLALFLAASNAADLTNQNYGDLSNEHANGNGYLTGGIALTSLVWSRTAGVAGLDSDTIIFTPVGGSIICRFAVIYDDTAVNKPLICYSLLDVTPNDVSAEDGKQLYIQVDSGGIFLLG
ncbi:MAG TPA: hypothetical protein ENI23_16010 [bacterium]|nr:hypothetical protein [bacterium]